MVTSVSGSISRPKNGEYAFARAFFNLGRPYYSLVLHHACSGRANLGRRVLVAVDTIKSLLCSVYYELRGIVSKETLSHIHNWLDWRSCSSFIDDTPGER
jgi:hypothetical protein